MGMDHRCIGASVTVLGLVVGFLPAQAPAQQDPDRLDAAVAKWLDSQHDSPEVLGAAVKAVLADEKRGIALVAKLMQSTAGKPNEPRSRGISQLATHVSLDFVKQKSAGPVVFAGQYAPLAPLRPFVVDLFFSWLVDTPDWFADTHRITLVPALRDLQPTLPDADKLEGVLAIVENEAIEPADLRSALACMLWQWGKKKYVQPRLDELRRNSSEGDTDDRASAMLQLADLQYTLRDYKAAAATHRALQSLAEHSGFVLKPVDWYSAACVHALNGDVERGIEALARCAELQASRDVDSSHKVEAKVFDTDPEIGALRRHPRFREIVEKAKKGRGPGEADPWK